MAKNNMTFTASMRLRTSEFKKGVAEINKSLNSLKNSFLGIAGALGAGLGLSKLLGNLKDTAVQLSVAKNVLENVSNETRTYTDGVDKLDVTIQKYGENLAYVQNLSDKYSQDLVALITNFGQFHAACNNTNISLEQQKDIFDALTRSAAYFHMSADRTKDMMNAIVQMVSKGKVAAEELRRQLGNALPGAFNIMAASLGVSTQQLDDMMRKGQVLSEDALPKFAAMLNTITKDANFDSLQMSLNRLKNAWYEFVENSGTENIFKKLVDGVGNALSGIARSMDTFKSKVFGIFSAIAAFNIFNGWKARGEQYLKDLDAQLGRAEASMKRLKSTMDASILKQKHATGVAGIGFTDVGTTKYAQANVFSDPKQIQWILEYNKQLLRANELETKLHGTPLMTPAEVQMVKSYNAELSKTVALENESKKPMGALAAGWQSIVGSVKSIWTTIKGMGIAALASAIIGVLMSIITYLVNIRKEWKRINGLVDDYKNRVQLSNEQVEENATKLLSNLRILQDENKAATQRVAALKEINKLTGSNFTVDALDKTKKAYQDIVKEVYRWIEATKKQAQVQAYAQEAAQAQIEIDKLNLRQDQLKREREKLNKGLFTGFKLGHIEIEESMNAAAIKQYEEIIRLANASLDELQVSLYDLANESAKDRDGDKETNITKLFKKYKEELAELDNQLKEGAITQQEYFDKFDNLVTKYWQSAAGTGKLSIEAIIEKADKGKTLTALEKWYKELSENAVTAAHNVALKVVEIAIDKSMDEAVKKAEDELDAAVKKIFDNIDHRVENVIPAENRIFDSGVPRAKTRDKTFDYKKSRADILEEEYNINEKLIDQLKEFIEKNKDLAKDSQIIATALDNAQKSLKEAQKNAPNLEKAMKIAQVREDIDNMKKEISDLSYKSFKEMADSVHKFGEAWKNVKEAIEDDDATEWDKFIAIFDSIIQVTETTLGIWKTIDELSRLGQKQKEAEISLTALENSQLERQLVLLQAIKMAKSENIGKTEEQAAANLAEAGASTVEASADAQGAVAGATKSGAKLPFPYNLAAIAAGVAAVIAALAAMSKFAEGGIVGGNSFSGDNQLARVNSGEMIINRHDQATLFNAIKSGKFGSGAVDFRIRGTDLIGVMNNEMSKRRG